MIDIDKLLGALDNDANESVMSSDWRSVHALRNDMLQRLHLPRDQLRDLNKRLKRYRYIDEVPDVRHGAYVRWVPLIGKNAGRLVTGGIVCEIKTDDGVTVICRNRCHRFFQFKMDACLLFQKVSDQEAVLLSALDYLHDK